ncbi:putative ubiquitin-conjugating enzyme E2 38 isoform X1 [Coffea arabica]|uniref:Ubiquitin-conjugating enzyme E2 38 isoform X1 n=1 Tax=Coffea arabica TaxID=13443 RepID=A0A6P6WXU5_COFAR|nr:putative ubiquitin-conjugating enzyme E2 38 isoform X1 [Coffea arabica]
MLVKKENTNFQFHECLREIDHPVCLFSYAVLVFFGSPQFLVSKQALVLPPSTIFYLLDCSSSHNVRGFPVASRLGDNKVAANTIEFPQFDILSGDSAHSDHYFIHSNKSKKAQGCFNDSTSAVSKKIAKEWKILEKDLPDSIYVRVYEQRIDLLRAVIIGAAGTPYHDGLFFLDIVLPSDYPNQPPKVYYHAHGLRLNPNLYSNGTVCLSLIHTWTGRGVELWTPAKSTILQLLVSIQGLVLNSKPYFNEPGREVGLYSKAERWTKKSTAYNEEVFILSCKTMLYNMRKAPKGFESFVVEHFRARGDFILAAIRAYINGDATVGQYQECVSASLSSVPVSSKFKANLEKMHLDLRSAFHGIDTSPPKMKKLPLEGRREEKEATSDAVKSRSSAKESKQGISSTILKVLKKIFE